MDGQWTWGAQEGRALRRLPLLLQGKRKRVLLLPTGSSLLQSPDREGEAVLPMYVMKLNARALNPPSQLLCTH